MDLEHKLQQRYELPNKLLDPPHQWQGDRREGQSAHPEHRWESHLSCSDFQRALAAKPHLPVGKGQWSLVLCHYGYTDVCKLDFHAYPVARGSQTHWKSDYVLHVFPWVGYGFVLPWHVGGHCGLLARREEGQVWKRVLRVVSHS